jgi:probable rRNA maturation factor
MPAARLQSFRSTAFQPFPWRTLAVANHHPRLRLDRRALVNAFRTLDEKFSPTSLSPIVRRRRPAAWNGRCPPGELSLVFLTDDALAKLHADFLYDPRPTDVITFEGDSAHGTAGEICVSVDAALRQIAAHGPAQQRRQNVRARFSAELTLYVVHGWLHLAGYDDLVPAKKRAMRRAEVRALHLLDQANPLPAFDLRPA